MISKHAIGRVRKALRSRRALPALAAAGLNRKRRRAARSPRTMPETTEPREDEMNNRAGLVGWRRIAVGAAITIGATVIGTTASASAATAPAGSVPAAPAHAAAIPKTLAAAQTKWPGAAYLPSGKATHAGRYLVRGPDGYTLMGVTVGPEIKRAAASPPGRALTNSARAANSGCWYISQEIYTYQYISTGYAWFDTWNHTPNSCGGRAYGDRLQPGCTGVVGCSIWQGPAFSGQGSWQVNGWVNLQVNTVGFSNIVYCRTYYQANGQFWSWCSP